MKRAFAAITLTLTLALSAFAQTKPAPPAPSYEQTQKWVVAKIIVDGGFNITAAVSHTYDGVSMDDCILTFTEIDVMSLAFQPTETTEAAFVIPLNKVTSVDVTEFHSELVQAQTSVNTFYVGITIAGKEAMETFTTKDDKEKVVSRTSHPTDRSSIAFGKSIATDKDLANRMQKALSHAVDLCTKAPAKEAF
jgi:hypothetical protein